MTKYNIRYKPFDPFYEIHNKKLGDVLFEMQKSNFATIRFFEETEHQRRAPQFCRFGDYMIHFAPYGTLWCGGMRGNGYISVVDNSDNKTVKQIAAISPDLSDYLGRLVTDREYLDDFIRRYRIYCK